MELVTHTCGERLWRHETGGVRAIVLYSDDGQREVHNCPRCGENLSDAGLQDADGRPIREAPSARD